ncbi:hypothetical protein GCM10022205_36520 [Spinactinospora alkalitolerans]
MWPGHGGSAGAVRGRGFLAEHRHRVRVQSTVARYAHKKGKEIQGDKSPKDEVSLT